MVKMKVLLSILISCLLFAGCQKERFPDTRARLEGNWEWVWSCGGIGGWSLTPTSEGYTQRLEFTEKKITKYRGDSVEFSIKYDLDKDTSSIMGNEVFLIGPGPDRLGGKLIFDVDSLFFFEECNDCFSHKYVRIE